MLVIIRLGKILSLIFFVFLVLSCRRSKQEKIAILWNDKQAIGISVPKSFLDDTPADSMSEFLHVRLEKTNTVAILGEHSILDDEIIFKPIIPFSSGLRYEIFFRNEQIGKIQIPSANAKDAPGLIAVYPTQDTLPGNLLKLYLQFSSPMREGESYKHISLLADNNDTIQDVFLNLQPELWNQERTVLTIWLDPGRIKRGLMPNKRLGNPLEKGKRYTLIVSDKWKDIQGLDLQQSYNKRFIVDSPDGISPDPEHWIMKLPTPDSNHPLKVELGESLDYFLLQETIQVHDENGNMVRGTLKISDEETKFLFIPHKKWQAGRYQLQVASHLEDLAGNNLNRIFDRDMMVRNTKADKINFERQFVIRE